MKLIITCLLFIPTFINAQQPLTPSKNAFQKKWLVPKSYQMTWYMLRDTAKMEMGKVFTHININKEELIVISQVQMKGVKSSWVDTSIAAYSTLMPIKHSSYNMQRDMELNFGRIVKGFYSDKMKKSTVDVSDTINNGYFDSNIYPVLIGLLPLKEGYKRDISIYDYNHSGKKGIMQASVTNVVSGVYQSEKSGLRSVWVVSVTDEISNSLTTYYFDKQDRRLWKQEIAANGRKMAMVLVEE